MVCSSISLLANLALPNTLIFLDELDHLILEKSHINDLTCLLLDLLCQDAQVLIVCYSLRILAFKDSEEVVGD